MSININELIKKIFIFNKVCIMYYALSIVYICLCICICLCCMMY